jgi:hypothetical protein
MMFNNNPPMNSNGLFGKTGQNPNSMNPNVSGFNSGNNQSSNYTFGSMTGQKSGVPVGSTMGGGLFSGQNNTT